MSTDTQNDLRPRRTKAGSKKRNKTKAARKRRQSKQAHQAPPKRERVRARKKIERFAVDPGLHWFVVRSEPTRAMKCAAELRARGLSVFEARVEEKIVADNGKARVARTPILRRLMFVGVEGWHESLPFGPGAYLQDVFCRGDGCWLWLEPALVGGSDPLRFSSEAIQRFADHVTGHLKDGEDAGDVLEALFAIGEMVRIIGGAYANFCGKVEAYIEKMNRYKVPIQIFGRDVSQDFDEDQLEAA